MANKVRATDDKLGLVHELTAELMLTHLRDALTGEYVMPPAEMGAITKFLKDNGIEVLPDEMANKFGAVLQLKPPSFTEEEALSM